MASHVEGKPLYDTALNIAADEIMGALSLLKASRMRGKGLDLHRHVTSLSKTVETLQKQIKLELELSDKKAAVTQRAPDKTIAIRLHSGLSEHFPKEVVKQVLDVLGLEYPK